MSNTNIKESATNVILEMTSSNTKRSLSKMTELERQLIVEKCQEYFESEDKPESFSVDDVQTFIWSYDPLFTDSGVLAFCKENKLI